MNAVRILAVASVAVLIGAGITISANAEEHHGGGEHHSEGGGGGGGDGDHYSQHHLPADEQYPASERYGLYPDGNGGVYHLKGDQIRHCRPGPDVDNALICSGWK